MGMMANSLSGRTLPTAVFSSLLVLGLAGGFLPAQAKQTQQPPASAAQEQRSASPCTTRTGSSWAISTSWPRTGTPGRPSRSFPLADSWGWARSRLPCRPIGSRSKMAGPPPYSQPRSRIWSRWHLSTRSSISPWAEPRSRAASRTQLPGACCGCRQPVPACRPVRRVCSWMRRQADALPAAAAMVPGSGR